jgi:hypothetical protein
VGLKEQRMFAWSIQALPETRKLSLLITDELGAASVELEGVKHLSLVWEKRNSLCESF